MSIFVKSPTGWPREVVSMRSLWAVEVDVRPREVVLMRSSCGILAEAGMGPLIKPAETRLVREMSLGRILIGEAAEGVDAGDASLGYSSEIWVAGCFQARFQIRLAADDALSSSLVASSSWGVCVALLQEDGFLCCGFWEGWGPGQRSNWGGVPGEVDSHHPLVRPHAVPGVSNNTGAMRRRGWRSHLTAAGTTLRPSWSGEGGTVLDGRRGLAARSGMQGPAFFFGGGGGGGINKLPHGAEVLARRWEMACLFSAGAAGGAGATLGFSGGARGLGGLWARPAGR